MVQKTSKLGGTASNVSVSRVAHGLMLMTWTPTPVPDEQCFEAIKAGVDALPAGTKMLLNSAEFYGPTMGTDNLEMLARFYAKYPDYADKTFVVVKGGFDRAKFAPNNSPEFLRASADNCQKALGPNKKVDVYEPARVDKQFPIEETMKVLVELKNEGKFDHIGLSECSAATLRRAHAVYPVSTVEIEVSAFSYEEETIKVIDAATELGVSVLAYSPLGRGMLTGALKSLSELPEGDMRHRFTRFKDEETLKHNLMIVDELKSFAETKGITVGQLCIAWVAAQSPVMIPIPGSSKHPRTLENLSAGDVELSGADVKKVSDIIASHGGVKGDRSNGMAMHLWG
ncbi:Aldo-ket-red domain-containing protein [Mycena indigotica]|uniref:Aldo-ket-red domain-containing protein n=1 Tax=Mycena indigotica TaxID=2126181 RepID=A0A8H6VPV2_9AGAR|nr:Aldo-ket-red domain-containing protein [Mycena indigotica]KAF7289289.1 Aldo-ket-red domain-containing protein [Mycena indigotica]